MMNEINDKVLDSVSGGTCAECREITSAIAESENSRGLGKVANALSYLPGCSAGGAYGVEVALDSMGIDADTSVGFMGIGSKKNTYVDRATGAKISHGEVLNYIRTGRKSW